MLQCTLTNDDEWDEKLAACLLAYQSSVQTLIGFTLHLMTFGCEMVLPLDVVYGQEQHDHVYEVVRKVRCCVANAYDAAREKMKMAQARQKRFYDSKKK